MPIFIGRGAPFYDLRDAARPRPRSVIKAANKANQVRPVADLQTIGTTRRPPEAAPIYRLAMDKSMTRGISRSTGMSSQTAVCSHQATRRIARRARMSSDGAMGAELLPGSERRSSTAARIGC